MNIVQLNTGDKNKFLYIDLDDIKSVEIEPYNEVDENRMLHIHFRAIGTNSIGQKFVLVFDSSSDKPDKVVQWVSANYLKKK